jgi:hypothetical protein
MLPAGADATARSSARLSPPMPRTVNAEPATRAPGQTARSAGSQARPAGAAASCDQRPEREAADVADRGDDARAAARRAVRPGVQIGDVGRGGRDRGAERDAGENARHQQAGERLPSDEDECRDAREDERRDQHGTPAVPVGHVSGEQEAHHDAGRVDRVDDRERERGQVLLLLVETVEGAGSGGEGRQDEKRERDRPEARAARESRERTGECLPACASTTARGGMGDRVHAASLRDWRRDRARALPWSRPGSRQAPG